MIPYIYLHLFKMQVSIAFLILTILFFVFFLMFSECPFMFLRISSTYFMAAKLSFIALTVLSLISFSLFWFLYFTSDELLLSIFKKES